MYNILENGNILDAGWVSKRDWFSNWLSSPNQIVRFYNHFCLRKYVQLSHISYVFVEVFGPGWCGNNSKSWVSEHVKWINYKTDHRLILHNTFDRGQHSFRSGLGGVRTQVVIRVNINYCYVNCHMASLGCNKLNDIQWKESWLNSQNHV